MHTLDIDAGPITTQARRLVSAGAPDAPWQAVRAGCVALHGPSLHALAALVATDDDSGCRWTAYRPSAFAPPNAILAAALAAAKQARADKRGRSKTAATGQLAP